MSQSCAFVVLTLIGGMSGSTSWLCSAANRMVSLHSGFSLYAIKYAMAGYVP